MLPIPLLTLSCYNNQLNSLPILPENLRNLYCNNNELTSLPDLPETLMTLCFIDNVIYQIIHSDDLYTITKKIQVLNKFRYSYYSLQFKNKFRNWLWERVRRPKIDDKYHPRNLIRYLSDENLDIEIVLSDW
jgi:Leucine-rich repeat (LRR) protein